MPTYTYKREDGSTFDIEQRITEDALEVCPTTGQKVKRIISGSAGLVFKGSGFYLTDYAKSGSTNGSSKEAGSDSATETKKESTSAESTSTESTSSSTSTSTSDD